MPPTLADRLVAHLQALGKSSERSLFHATNDEIRAAAAASATDLEPADPPPGDVFGFDFAPPVSEPGALAGASAAVEGLEEVRAGRVPELGQLVRATAIVLRADRPAVDVVDDGFDALPAPWEALSSAALKPRLQAIGRLRANSAPYHNVAGTGFVVASDLLMTNRHVAKYFVDGVGSAELELLVDDEEPGCDLAAENRRPPRSVPLELAAAVLVHPYWDVALLRVQGAALAGIEPLRLRAERPEPDDLVGDEVAVVGYPVQQYLADRELRDLRRMIFGDRFGVKKLTPGTVLARFEAGMSRPAGGDRDVAVVGHDASTLAGNSGSAVLDPESGDVLAVHYRGYPLDANFAVPAWELGRDTRLRDLGVRFTGPAAEEPAADVEAAWAELDA